MTSDPPDENPDDDFAWPEEPIDEEFLADMETAAQEWPADHLLNLVKKLSSIGDKALQNKDMDKSERLFLDASNSSLETDIEAILEKAQALREIGHETLARDFLSAIHSAVIDTFIIGQYAEVSKTAARKLSGSRAEIARGGNTEKQQRNAEAIREIVESAKRRPDGRFLNLQTVLQKARNKLENQKLDRKTFIRYVDILGQKKEF